MSNDLGKNKENWSNKCKGYYQMPMEINPILSFLERETPLDDWQNISRLENELQCAKERSDVYLEFHILLVLLDHYNSVVNKKDDKVSDGKVLSRMEFLVDAFLRRLEYKKKSFLEILMFYYYKGLLLKWKGLIIKRKKGTEYFEISLEYFLCAEKQFEMISENEFFPKKNPNFLCDYGCLFQDIADYHRSKNDQIQEIFYCEKSLSEFRKFDRPEANGTSKNGMCVYETFFTGFLDDAYKSVMRKDKKYSYDRFKNLMFRLKRIRVVSEEMAIFRIQDELKILDRISSSLFDHGRLKKSYNLLRRIFRLRSKYWKIWEKNNKLIGIKKDRNEEEKRKQMVEDYCDLSKISLQLGNRQKSCFYFNKGFELSKSLKNQDDMKMIHSVFDVHKMLKMARENKKMKDAFSSRRSKEKRQEANVCASCGISYQNKKMKVCQGCKIFFYCSRACQKKDWKDHKLYCVNVDDTLIK